jgi:hypothetical protein
MTDDIKKMRALATRADSISRALDHHRRTVAMSAADAGALHRIATTAREFYTAVEAGFAALPARFK